MVTSYSDSKCQYNKYKKEDKHIKTANGQALEEGVSHLANFCIVQCAAGRKICAETTLRWRENASVFEHCT